MNYMRSGNGSSSSGSSSRLRDMNSWNTMDRDWNTVAITVLVFEMCAGSIAVLGIAANIVNIVVFLKHGFTEVMNISLMGMAVSDFGALFVTVCSVILTNPWFRNSGLIFDSLAINIPFAGMPRHVFGHITCWITVFITFERCVCVVFPLKVKSIFTATRLKIIIVAIYVMNILSVIPYYLTFQIGWKYYPFSNSTLLTILPLAGEKKWKDMHSVINGVLSIVAFLLTVLFTAALVIKLIEKSKWRMSTANQGKGNNTETLSTRDRKVVKMVIVISAILIACYFPSTTFSLLLIVLPSLQYTSRATFYVFWRFAVLTECINSAVNIFIYYSMSSKFRATCKELFPCFGRKKSDGDGKKN